MKKMQYFIFWIFFLTLLVGCSKRQSSLQVKIIASFQEEYTLSELSSAKIYVSVSNNSNQIVKVVDQLIVVNDYEIVSERDGKLFIEELGNREDEVFDATPSNHFGEGIVDVDSITLKEGAIFSVCNMPIVKIETLGCQTFGTNIDTDMKYHWSELKPRETKKIPLQLKEHLFVEPDMENNYRVRIFLNQNDFEGAVKKISSPVYQIRVVPDKYVKE